MLAPAAFGSDGALLGEPSPDGRRRLAAIGIRELEDSEGNALTLDPNYLALPPADDDVEFDVVWVGPATKDRPVFLDDVHPVELWRDILDGKFGRLQDGVTGSGDFGDVTWTIDYDTTAFANLIADTSIPKASFRIKESADLREWVEENICRPYGLAYYLNEDGEVVPLDLRLPSSLSGLTTIDDADVTTVAPRWEHSRTSAITMAEASYYVERPFDDGDVSTMSGEYPPIDTSRLIESENRLVIADFADASLKENAWEIDGLGHRAFSGLYGDRLRAIQKTEADLRKILELSKASYAGGAYTTTLQCTRSSDVTGLTFGDIVILDVDALPDPASNTRGGARLARVVGYEPHGPVVDVTFLDLGPNSTSVVPVLGTPAQTTGETLEAIDVPVTLNAAGERVLLEYAITDTATGTRPVEGSALWTLGEIVVSSRTVTLRGLPSGSRIWLRARSQSTDAEETKLPSAWVFTSPSYIDTSGLVAPTLDAVTVYTATTAELTWTNADANAYVEVWLEQGADEMQVVTLEPGTEGYELRGLDGSTTYTAKIRARDGLGGVSSFSSQSFTTSASQPTAPAVFGVAVILGTRVA